MNTTLQTNILHTPISHAILEIIKMAAWPLGMATAVAIFFQFHVALPVGLLNLNLAAPFTILALVAVGLHALLLRHTLPACRQPMVRLAQVSAGGLWLADDRCAGLS